MAILDGRVDLEHACFAGARLREAPLAEMPTDVEVSVHGTHIAGILMAQPASGDDLVGLVPDCDAISIPIYWSLDGASCPQERLARAIEQALDLGARVINLSGGELTAGAWSSPVLVAAVERCAAAGALLVAAAGNDGCACLHVPAAMPGVLAVGAMDRQERPLPFSNWGDKYRSNGLLVLGEDIPGPRAGGGIRHSTSTSCATAVASGVVALLLSLQQRHGAIDVRAVYDALLASARPCEPARDGDCQRILAGRLDIEAAVRRLRTETAETAAITPSEAGIAVPSFCPLPAPALCSAAPPTTGVAASDVPQPTSRPDSRAAETPDEEKTAMVDHQEDSHEVQPVAESDAQTAVAWLEAETATVAEPAGIQPSDCGCGGSSGSVAASQLIYVVGNLGYDFGSRAMRESFAAEMDGNPDDPNNLLALLAEQPYASSDLIWTLDIDGVPAYSVRPEGPYAAAAYQRLAELFAGQQGEYANVQRVSVPGALAGQARLSNNRELGAICPNLRGLIGWNTQQLVNGALDGNGSAEHRQQLQSLVDRFLYELRNPGLAPTDRAMNAAATMAFRLSDVLQRQISASLALDTVDVARSRFASPGADSWDVNFVFFDPQNVFERARQVFRFTIDVSTELPVRVGEVSSWATFSNPLR